MVLVGNLTSDNMKISITLADQLDLMTRVSATTCKVSDLELICGYYVIAREVDRAIELIYPMGICIPFTRFSIQSNSIPTCVSSSNILLY
jgi:hypothetical protein